MTDINQIAYLATGWTGQTLLNDNVWKAFGFKGRPRRGKYFDFLIPKQKLRFEKFLFKELFALSIVDIAQASKTIDNWVEDHCDFRMLLLTGVIGNAWIMGIYDNLDDLLETIKQVNKYTNDTTDNSIPQSFVDRLMKQVNLDDKKKVIVMYGAANLLASSNKENGLVGINDTYRTQLKQYKPTGKLSSKLDKDQLDKIAWVALDLINN